jgi:hypothetical protein
MVERVALIDADIIAWKCATATERTWYMGREAEEFKYKSEAEDYCVSNGLEYSAYIDTEVRTEPFGLTKSNVDSMMEAIIRDTESTAGWRAFLTGKGNYREQLATVRPYKGNRPKVKPFNLAATKDYLIEKWGATVVDGMEADDALGIAQMAIMKETGSIEHSVICSTDKDLKQIPGLHYNFTSCTMHTQAYGPGMKLFFLQALMGDSTDNIEGIEGVGKMGAQKILADTVSPEEMEGLVFDAYHKKYGIEEGTRRCREMMDLVWIQREKGVLYTSSL